jgi:lipoprotein-releasing system ATP-binding protein
MDPIPTQQTASFIAARALSKQFDGSGSTIEILKSVDFDIASGETLAIVGASGIGKSTVLNLLGTLDRPDSGTLCFRGDNVFDYDHEALARFRNQTIGFVFQFHYLLPEFTALENAMMPGLIKGQTKAQAGEAAEGLLRRVGLQDRLTHRVNQLSGGEQQRVALARALVLSPDILLADEPTGNLDKRNSERVHEMLLELNNELKMTMVVVTHNAELSGYMSRRVTIIDGQLVETD